MKKELERKNRNIKDFKPLSNFLINRNAELKKSYFKQKLTKKYNNCILKHSFNDLTSGCDSKYFFIYILRLKKIAQNYSVQICRT